MTDITQKDWFGFNSAFGAVAKGYQRTRGFLKRRQAVLEAVEREIKKRYPGGLASSESGMLERKKIKKDIIDKISQKNKTLLNY